MSIFDNLLSAVNEAALEYRYGNYLTWVLLMLECFTYCILAMIGFMVCAIICLIAIPLNPTISLTLWLRSLTNAKQK